MPVDRINPQPLNRPLPARDGQKQGGLLDGLGSAFGDLMNGFGQVVNAGLPLAGQMMPMLLGAGGLGGGALNSLGAMGGLGGLGGGSSTAQQMQLLQLQQKIQQESQIFQTLTNVSKARFDAEMTAVRNIRP